MELKKFIPVRGDGLLAGLVELKLADGRDGRRLGGRRAAAGQHPGQQQPAARIGTAAGRHTYQQQQQQGLAQET